MFDKLEQTAVKLSHWRVFGLYSLLIFIGFAVGWQYAKLDNFKHRSGYARNFAKNYAQS